MKIAIMGTRGIPANYGGFETFAEKLSTRLVKRGHEVTVYGRSNIIDYDGDEYQGVRLAILPTIAHKYFDTIAHTFLSVLHGLGRSYDVVLICNSVNSAFSWIPRLRGQKVALNVDGLEWQRAKWNRAGQWVYRFSEYLATFLPHHVVTDSRFIERYYLDRFGKPSTFIPYGAPTEPVATKAVLDRFGLKPREYVLYVSRLEPENNAHHIVRAFERVQTEKKLVVVGDAPYNHDYIRALKETKDPRILFTGYVFGDGYHEFQSHAYCYVQATEVGGTHPALLEGMGFGNCIIAHDVPEHREALGDAGCYYGYRDIGDLAAKLQRLLDHPEEVEAYRLRAAKRAREEYSWDKVTSDYEALFHRLLGRAPVKTLLITGGQRPLGTNTWPPARPDVTGWSARIWGESFSASSSAIRYEPADLTDPAAVLDLMASCPCRCRDSHGGHDPGGPVRGRARPGPAGQCGGGTARGPGMPRHGRPVGAPLHRLRL